MEQTTSVEQRFAQKKLILEIAHNLVVTGFKHCIPKPYVIIEFNERIKK
jgi:hypothetical protein